MPAVAERERLDSRRAAKTCDVEAGGLRYRATVGRFPDGRVAEIFIDMAKDRLDGLKRGARLCHHGVDRLAARCSDRDAAPRAHEGQPRQAIGPARRCARSARPGGGDNMSDAAAAAPPDEPDKSARE